MIRFLKLLWTWLEDRMLLALMPESDAPGNTANSEGIAKDGE